MFIEKDEGFWLFNECVKVFYRVNSYPAPVLCAFMCLFYVLVS